MRADRSTWRRAFATALCGALAVPLAASAAAEAAVPTVTVPGAHRVLPPGDAPVRTLAGAVAGLGYEVGRASAGPHENWVLSPLSLACAFGMVRAGARGGTADQLDRVLGFPATGLHDGFNALTRRLAATAPLRADPDGPRPPIVRIANGLFPQQGLTVGEPFLRTLAEQYGVGVHPVDFSRHTAVEAINAWTRQQTAGRIHELFDNLDPGTKLVLANAVYLRADWRLPFDETASAPFTRAGGDPVSVPTMHQVAPLRYADGPGWQAVELPYAGSDLAMWVLVPAAGTPPDDLLAPASLARIGTGLDKQVVDLAMPKWDFGTTVDLVPPLRALGLTAPFEPDADFSGIAPGLFIDRAVQRATITVDERGTEAAAVTGFAMTASGLVGQPVKVRADRPFAFAVVHVPTGTPLFVGRVADPAHR